MKKFFQLWKKKIIFLYLDNYDYIYDAIRGKDWVNKVISDYKDMGYILNNKNSELAHFNQLKLSYQYLHSKSLVLIDDTFKRYNFWEGKGKDCVPYLLERNWIIKEKNEAPKKHWEGYILFSKINI